MEDFIRLTGASGSFAEELRAFAEDLDLEPIDQTPTPGGANDFS